MLVPYMQADGFRKDNLEKVEEMKCPIEQGSQVVPKEKQSSSTTTEVNQQLTMTLVHSVSCMNFDDQLVTALTTG